MGPSLEGEKKELQKKKNPGVTLKRAERGRLLDGSGEAEGGECL